MTKLIKIVGVLVLVVMPSLMHSQQDPQYTQYTYAMGLLNPAYVAITDELTITTLGRRQWAGVQGAPQTLSLTAGLPVLDGRGGVALSLISDEIGPAKESNIFADFSYDVQLSDTYSLALGLRGGVSLLDVSTLIFSTSAFDPLDVPVSLTSPTLGFGLFFYGEKMFMGVAVPNFLESVHIDRQVDFVSTSSEVKHVFATMGYVFDLDETMKLKPSTMLKLGSGGNTSMDISANILIDEQFEFGLSHRLDLGNSLDRESISALFAFSIDDQFRIGYSFDYSLSTFEDFNSGSHEIMLSFRIKGSRRSCTPCFF